MRLAASVLCEALRAANVTITSTSANTIVARPSAAVSPELLTLLKRFKVELLNVRRRNARAGLSPEFAPCSGCDAEFVHPSETLCPWCRVADITAEFAPHRSTTPQPMTRSAPRTTVLTVPKHDESSSQGQLGQLGHLYR